MAISMARVEILIMGSRKLGIVEIQWYEWENRGLLEIVVQLIMSRNKCFNLFLLENLLTSLEVRMALVRIKIV